MTNSSQGKIMAGAAVIAVVVAVAGYFLGGAMENSPSTAPTNPPDRAGTETTLPAGPADPRTQASTSSEAPAKP
jgi:hypothetical protein